MNAVNSHNRIYMYIKWYILHKLLAIYYQKALNQSSSIRLIPLHFIMSKFKFTSTFIRFNMFNIYILNSKIQVLNMIIYL